MPEQSNPSLASYRSLQDYNPRFADFVVRCGWFRTWVGVVNNFDPKTNVISIIFEGTPRLLFSMTEDEMRSSTYTVNLDSIRNSRKYSWHIQQVTDGQPVWYV